MIEDTRSSTDNSAAPPIVHSRRARANSSPSGSPPPSTHSSTPESKPSGSPATSRSPSGTSPAARGHPHPAYTYFTSKEHLVAELHWRILRELPGPGYDGSASLTTRLSEAFAKQARRSPMSRPWPKRSWRRWWLRTPRSSGSGRRSASTSPAASRWRSDPTSTLASSTERCCSSAVRCSKPDSATSRSTRWSPASAPSLTSGTGTDARYRTRFHGLGHYFQLPDPTWGIGEDGATLTGGPQCHRDPGLLCPSTG